MKTFKENMREVMVQAWQFVKCNGFTMSEALKVAWLNLKLRLQMATRIVKFWFTKVDGSIREAYGTLKSDMMPETKGVTRKANKTIQTYYDTEKGEFRCFKVANLIKVNL